MRDISLCGRTNERPQSLFIDHIILMKIDCAARIALKAGIKQPGGVRD